MADDKQTKNVGTVFLTFFAGAVLGAGVAFLLASQKEELESSNYDEADLFV